MGGGFGQKILTGLGLQGVFFNQKPDNVRLPFNRGADGVSVYIFFPVFMAFDKMLEHFRTAVFRRLPEEVIMVEI
jgi:hypothetical protein